MPHAFRSAALIEAENAQRKIERLRTRWASTRDSWYDGTANSVDQRIANIDEVIAFAKSIGSRLHAAKVGSDALALLGHLRTDRMGLEAMRERLLTAGDCPPGIPCPTSEGLSHLPPERVKEMRENRQHWRSQDDDWETKKAALDFIEGENTEDRTELLFRAQRAVEQRTWDWSPQASQAAVRDFLGALDAVIPEPSSAPRTAAVETVGDFNDYLMFN